MTEKVEPLLGVLPLWIFFGLDKIPWEGDLTLRSDP